MMKRLLCLCLSLLLLWGLSVPARAGEVPEVPAASSGTCGDGLSWTLDNRGTLTISGTGAMPDYKSPEAPWRNSSGSVKAIVIQPGVTRLGAYAFQYCSNAVSVQIPDTVTDIGSHCFYNCKALKTIAIPDSVTVLNKNTFYFCTSLETVTFSQNLTAIGDYCFYYCKKLTDPVLPASLQQIGNNAFDTCESLSALTLPEGLLELGREVFCDTGLTTLTLPASLQSVGYGITKSCDKLTQILCHPDNPYFASLDGVLFNSSFTSLIQFPSGRAGEYTVPESVSQLYNACFFGCANLTKVTLPEGLEWIEEAAFYCTALTEITIPESVLTLGALALADCDNLKSVTLPKTMQFIGASCFLEDKNLETVVMPEQVEEIYYSCFNGCASLKDITLPQGISYLGSQLFDGCASLEEITIPANITKIENIVFRDCKNLKKITFLGAAPFFGGDYGGGRIFTNVTATAYYPDNDPTWTEDIRQNYGGTITWKPYDAHIHSYTPTVTPPTCTEGGYTTYQCGCGDFYTKDQTPALGHDYVNHICTRCGEEDPDRPQEDPVVRIAGSGRQDTAFKAADQLKKVLKVQKFTTIILASGDNFADALAGSYLATVKRAPILLCRPGNTAIYQQNLAYIQENLTPDGIVYILGGTAAVPQAQEDLLTGCGIRAERLKGSTRFDTNLVILDTAGIADQEEILVSTGYNFADSLSASASGKPILLLHSNANVLTEAQKVWLEDQRGKCFTIIGGTGAVSQALEDALAAYGSVTRLKGSGREATSVEVAKAYFRNPDTVFLAYSRNFPDGLCGGPLAYAMKAPLLLVNVNQEGPARDYVSQNGITRGRILGGTGVVKEETARTVFGLAEDYQIPKL